MRGLADRLQASLVSISASTFGISLEGCRDALKEGVEPRLHAAIPLLLPSLIESRLPGDWRGCGRWLDRSRSPLQQSSSVESPRMHDGAPHGKVEAVSKGGL
ncbi:MAG: hypothetical protein CMM07_13685 [Rhodopirellula sp.]|nr:hypothetical protein [Rhodopirellula sp.]